MLLVPVEWALAASCAVPTATHGSLVSHDHVTPSTETFHPGTPPFSPLVRRICVPTLLSKVVSAGARGATTSNGQACFWFSNGCTHGCQPATVCTRMAERSLAEHRCVAITREPPPPPPPLPIACSHTRVCTRTIVPTQYCTPQQRARTHTHTYPLSHRRRDG
jgi:hypothetical protein